MPVDPTNELPSLKGFLREYRWFIISGLWLFALALGCVGFGKAMPGRTHLDHLYMALQLFPMQLGTDVRSLPWELEVARFLAPLVLAYTAVQTAAALMHEKVGRFRIRFFSGHAIVCGLGRKGMQLITDFRQRGIPVIAFEADAENPFIARCRELGAVVIIGDSTDLVLLKRARVHHASYLVCVSGNDGVNVETAVRACDLCEKHPVARSGNIQCFVHLIDFPLRGLLQQHRIFTNSNDQFEIGLFNVFENTAWRLLEKYPLDRGTDGHQAGQVQLVVVGFGQMGACIVLQALKIAHYEHGRKLRVIVLDQDAERKKRIFLLRHPGVEAIADVSFHSVRTDDPDFLEGRLWKVADPARSFTTLAMCFDDDSRNLACALTLLPKLDRGRTRVMVRMTDNAGLSALLEKTAGASPGHNLCPFELFDNACTRDALLSPDRDKIARLIHESYLRVRASKGDSFPKNPNFVPWERLLEEIKDSNREQADHIPVKLRIVGCSTRPVGKGGGVPFEFTKEEVEQLARIEHDRWIAGRLLAGWTLGATKDITARTSPNLIPWSELDEKFRDNDRWAVRNIPSLMASVGMEIVRGNAVTR